MPENIDLTDLANELVEIAQTTTDDKTGLRLIKVVVRLLARAVLYDDDRAGGEPFI